MNLQPVTDRVVIKPLAVEEKSPGGILIPDNAKEKQRKGKILAVGPGRISDYGTTVRMGVSVGQTVLYDKYSGVEVEADGELYLIIRESDILTII